MQNCTGFPSVGISNGNGTLFRCPFVVPFAAYDDACISYPNFSIAAQIPVMIQRARANLSSALVWGPPAFVPNALLTVKVEPPVFGISVSWPYAGGAIYSPLSTMSIAEIMVGSLQSFALSFVPPSPINSVTSLLTNNSVVYLVDATPTSTGVFLGGAYGVNKTLVVKLIRLLVWKANLTPPTSRCPLH